MQSRSPAKVIAFPAVGLLVSLLVSACSATVTLSDPSPTPTSPASAETSSPSPGSTPPALAAVGFSCRLPVASSDAPLNGNAAKGSRGKGGFITFPDATFKRDPQSLGTYDAAASKWLPVPYTWMAPDGSAYAYADGETVYVVNARSGTGRSLRLSYPVIVVGYDTAGVYLVELIAHSDAKPHGLDLLDPSTGAYTRLNPGHQLSYSLAHGGIAYVLELNSNWGNPPTDGPKPIGNELYFSYLDKSVYVAAYLGISSVMSIADAAILVLGFDGGDQLVLSARSTSYYRIYTAASIRPGGTPSMPAGPPQYEGPPNAEWNPTGPARGDTHGVWFASKSGSIWLYSPGKGMQRVAQLPMRSPMIAGPCL